MSTLPKRLKRAELTVLVCGGKDCRANGSKAVRRALRAPVKALGLRKSTLVLQTKCTGNCKRGPICGIQPHNVWLAEADPARACAVLDDLLNGE